MSDAAKGDSSANAQAGTSGESQKDNSKTNESKQQGKNNTADSSSWEKQLAERDGTISALTKKLNDLEKGNKDFSEGLKKALGIEDPDAEKDDRSWKQKLNDTVESLVKENQLAKTEKAISKVLNDWKTEKGSTLTDNVKGFILKQMTKVGFNDTNPDKIKEFVQSSLEDLADIVGDEEDEIEDEQKKRQDDERSFYRKPVRSAFAGSRNRERVTANAILKELAGEK